MEKRAIHQARQIMWQRPSAESAWQRGILFGRQVKSPALTQVRYCWRILLNRFGMASQRARLDLNHAEDP
jgi:hypothetical protein